MADYGFLRTSEQTTVGDVLRRKSGGMPELVHVHPQDTVREAIDILREYGVSQMPVVGAGEPVDAAVSALQTADAAVVLADGKPAGVITRQDLLTHLAT